jgi:hypothetical protein
VKRNCPADCPREIGAAVERAAKTPKGSLRDDAPDTRQNRPGTPPMITLYGIPNCDTVRRTCTGRDSRPGRVT